MRDVGQSAEIVPVAVGVPDPRTVTTRVRGDISRCKRSGVSRSSCARNRRTDTPRRRNASHGTTLAGNSLSQTITSSPSLHGSAVATALAPALVFVTSAISLPVAPIYSPIGFTISFELQIVGKRS